jgi:hypothetical protein
MVLTKVNTYWRWKHSTDKSEHSIYEGKHSTDKEKHSTDKGKHRTELVFLNVYGAQESIPRHQFR